MTALLVRGPAGFIRLVPGQRLLVGREGDIAIADARVSRHHAEVVHESGRWILRDLGSRNGTFIGRNRISTVHVAVPCTVRLGGAEHGPRLDLEPEPAHPAAPQSQRHPDTLHTGHQVTEHPGPSNPGHPGTGHPTAGHPTAGHPTAGHPSAGHPGTGHPSAGHPSPGHPGSGHPGAGHSGSGQGWGGVPEGVTQLGRPAVQGRPSELPERVLPLTGVLRIGRAADNDLALPDDLLISRHHAEIHRSPNGPYVRDLRSRNGTHVNGHRVTDAYVQPGDLVSVGHYQLVVHRDHVAVHADTGAVSLRAEELTVKAGSAVLLDRVSLRLDACSLLAVVGPSGAGKSTLLGALTGARPATHGRMLYEGRDLYAHYDDLRHRIGLVPQDDILHKELTVERALGYAAALRFPQDVTRAERRARIDEVIDQLDLAERRKLRIDRLSGGQRKRTSVALELLTKPSLLFLDEPTSGLDPSLDKEVMNTLRELADDGRTVVVVTHSVLHLNVCDRVLVLCRGGKVGYFGPPGELLGFFGATEYSEVFKKVSDEADLWADRFRRSSYYTRYCGGGSGQGLDGHTVTPPPAPPKQSMGRQFAILSRRMFSVIRSDKLAALSMVGLPIILALMTRVVEGSAGLAPPGGKIGRSEEAGTLLIILVFGAALMGLIGAIREIVKEGPIYRRERSVGLSPVAYLLSKAAVLGAINVVQAALFVTLAMIGRKPPADPLIFGSGSVEIIVVVSAVAFTCSLLALLVSALVSTNEQAMLIMVVLVMAQFVFIGKLIEVVGRTGLEQFTWLIPTRWGYAAAAATTNLQKIDFAKPKDALWDHDPAGWLRSMAVLILMSAVLALATRLALRRYEAKSR
ncbi:FHA domain-containing protein [Nonomuraea sp. NPDC050394]|uniref:FHA domain-containing protein n=1 Tax=Nonomuraea sp. NPDC050394 TaxID=3364363 RepID=UPI00379270C7